MRDTRNEILVQEFSSGFLGIVEQKANGVFVSSISLGNESEQLVVYTKEFENFSQAFADMFNNLIGK